MPATSAQLRLAQNLPRAFAVEFQGEIAILKLARPEKRNALNPEIVRGLDVFELTPSGFLSQNEIDAAKTVRQDYLNAQGQPKLVWPPSFALARAYVDQLERSKGLGAGRISDVRKSLVTAETASGTQRGDALMQLATQLDGDARRSSDSAKVAVLAGAIRDLVMR